MWKHWLHSVWLVLGEYLKMVDQLTIVMPAYNEEKSLKAFLPEFIDYINLKGFKAIIVNDGSKDNTAEVLKEFDKEPLLQVVNKKVNTGYGGAIKSGIQNVDTKYVITMDADAQHHFSDVEKLFSEVKKIDADMIVGRRNNMGIAGFYRRLGRFLIRTIARTLMPIKIHDINSGMKVYRTELAKKYIKLCPDSMAFSDIITMVFVSQKHLVEERLIDIKAREAGVSTISTQTAIETLIEIINIVVLFNPLKIFLPLSIFLFFGGVAWGMKFILAKQGLSLGALLGIIAGLLFFFLGLIAEQLSLIRKNSL
jgi:glycosyltransferase involved in cell wall biosynthesis